MSEYKYMLEPYKGLNTRFICPKCKRKELTRYINIVTNEYLETSVGRCNRESNCGYHFTPKQYLEVNNISIEDLKSLSKIANQPPKDISFIEKDIFKASLKDYEQNHFIKFLVSVFNKDIANSLISKYYIGSSKYWEGSTVFWQIDVNGKIRTGKIMLYNSENGKRVKKPFNHINWAHKVVGKSDFELRQCLYGEHLLIKDKIKPVAIVESEKTAIICSVYLPEFLWLASGSLQNISCEKFKVLQGRDVTLFPDLKAYEKWNLKAKELKNITRVSVSDLLERSANEKEKDKGLDIADYLLRINYSHYRYTELIKDQLSSLNMEYWVLNMTTKENITNYNLKVLCDTFILKYKLHITPEIYYTIISKINPN